MTNLISRFSSQEDGQANIAKWMASGCYYPVDSIHLIVPSLLERLSMISLSRIHRAAIPRSEFRLEFRRLREIDPGPERRNMI